MLLRYIPAIDDVQEGLVRAQRPADDTDHDRKTIGDALPSTFLAGAPSINQRRRDERQDGPRQRAQQRDERAEPELEEHDAARVLVVGHVQEDDLPEKIDRSGLER